MPLTHPLAAYVDLMRGLKGHYAHREDSWSATFAAVSLLTTLFVANIASATVLLNQLRHEGRMTLGPWVNANRGAIIVFAIAMLGGHELLARLSHLYSDTAIAAASWKQRFRLYLGFTVVLFIMPLLIVVGWRVRLG
jgi:hypothetical protein